MKETVDGAYQKYATAKGDYIREHFFGPDPRLRKLVEHLSDDDLRTSGAAGTTMRSSTPPTSWRPSTAVLPPSSWPRPSRAGPWGRASWARMSPTS